MTLYTKKKQRWILLLSFLLPFLVSTLACALKGIAPFGPYSILRSDAWAQYHPFLSLFRHTLLNGGSLEHTWSIGMGENFLPTIAYYLSSPLYLLSVLVPESLLGQFVAFLTVLKLSLGGMFFAYFLRYTYRSEDPVLPFFALLYSLCGWATGYYWNIMWLDVFALLPILIVGTLAMLRESRFRLYTLSLAMCLWCNYYIAFCCCLFVLLCFLGYQICKWTGWKNFLRSFLRFGICTCLATAMVLVLLIPTLMGMQNASASRVNSFGPFDLVIPDDFYGFSFLTMITSLSQLAGRTLANTPPTDLRGLPNLHSGFTVLILAFTFLFNKSFSKKDRLFHGVLILFFVVSLIFKITTFLWHGFHFPNMLPGRFTFLFTFALLTMAYRGYSRLQDLSIPRCLYALGCGSLVLLLGILNRRELSLGYYTLAINILLLGGTAVIMLLRKGIKLPPLDPATGLKIGSVLLAVMLLGEGFLSAYAGIKKGLDETDVIDLAITGQTLYASVAEKDPELFFRTDMSYGGTSNDGAVNHYNGVDVFSSTALCNHGQLASALGIRAWPESNSNTLVESSDFTYTLCGVKYLITRDEVRMDPDPDTLIGRMEDLEIRRNPSYLGVGFMTDSKLAQFASLEENKDPFAEQAEMFRLATGLDGELYSMIYEPELIASEGCSFEYTKNNSQFLYKVPQDMDHGTFTLRYIMEAPGLLCMATRMQGGQDVEIYRNGELILTTGVVIRGILSLGHVEPGDVFELVYTSDNFKEAGINNYMAIQNDALLEQGLELLSDEVWNITYVDNTTLTGTITALSDGLFYSSVPYEPGWTVTVDGEEVPVGQTYDPKNPDVKLTDGQICFPLSAGEHEITMSYKAPGLRLGLILSLVALAVFLALILCKKETLLPDLIPTEKENPHE